MSDFKQAECHWCNNPIYREDVESRTDGDGHYLCDPCYDSEQTEVDADFGAVGLLLVVVVVLGIIIAAIYVAGRM